MIDQHHIQDIEDLLQALKPKSELVIVKLGANYQQDRDLVDQIILKVQKTRGTSLQYKKLSGELSARLKTELQVSQNPVLLFIQHGELKALLEGLVAQYQIEEIIEAIERP